MIIPIFIMLLTGLTPKGFGQFEKYESKPSDISKENPPATTAPAVKAIDQKTEPSAHAQKSNTVNKSNEKKTEEKKEEATVEIKENPKPSATSVPVVKNIPNTPPPSSAAPTPPPVPQESLSKKDAFGRQTGIKGMDKIREKNKYVNLNPETAFGPEVITSFDFPDTSLADLTKHMQKLTGINLIIDKALKGKISISAPSPITVGDAWRAYLTALNMNGYALVKTGAFYKVVQSREI
ncbi:MAG: hypothetical protein OXB84_06135, partial [Halobacteriovoraceae bacterium]|nr:hypothetical protein [Halobacteriovoraceae bacterium]